MPEPSAPAAVQPNHLDDWTGCLNARDVGGMPTASGGMIAERALVRTDRLSRLTDEGIAAFRAYGVSRIIDLRRPTECEREPSPFADDPIYRNIPVQNPADPDHEWLELAEIYIAMLDLRPDLYASAVGEIADAPPGAVVVHCAGGKDRTGLVVAFALAIAGVPDQLIADDYALTEARLRDDSAVQVERADPAKRENVRRLQPTPASNVHRVFEHLRSAHGGVEEFLDAAGLGAARRAVIRERLLAG